MAATTRKIGELEERVATLREEMKQPMMDKLSAEVQFSSLSCVNGQMRSSASNHIWTSYRNKVNWPR